MYLCIFIYVSTYLRIWYLCIHVPMYVFMYVCMYVWMDGCMNVCMDGCVRAYIYVGVYVCVFMFNVPLWILLDQMIRNSFTQQLHSKPPCPGFFSIDLVLENKAPLVVNAFFGSGLTRGIIESCSFRTNKMEDTEPWPNTCGGRCAKMIHSAARLKYQWHTGYHRIMFCLICKGFLPTCFQDQFPHDTGIPTRHQPNLPSTRWTFHVDASEFLVVNQISLIVCPITFHKFHTSQVVFSDFFWTIPQISHQSLKTSWSGSPSTFHSPAIFRCTLGLASMLPPKLGSRNSGCQRLRRAEGCSGTPGKLTAAALARSGVAVEEAGLRRCGWDGDEVRVFFFKASISHLKKPKMFRGGWSFQHRLIYLAEFFGIC